MTATEARLVQQRYARQQVELTEVNAKAKWGETVSEATEPGYRPSPLPLDL